MDQSSNNNINYSRRGSLTSLSSISTQNQSQNSIVPRNLSTGELLNMDDKFVKKSMKKNYQPSRPPTTTTSSKIPQKALSPVQLQIQAINNMNSASNPNSGFTKNSQGTYLFPNGEVFRPRTTPSKRNRPPKIGRNSISGAPGPNTEVTSSFSVNAVRSQSLTSVSTLSRFENTSEPNRDTVSPNSNIKKPIPTSIHDFKESSPKPNFSIGNDLSNSTHKPSSPVKTHFPSTSTITPTVLNNKTVNGPSHISKLLPTSLNNTENENCSLNHSNSTITKSSEHSNSLTLINRTTTSTPQTSVDYEYESLNSPVNSHLTDKANNISLIDESVESLPSSKSIMTTTTITNKKPTHDIFHAFDQNFTHYQSNETLKSTESSFSQSPVVSGENSANEGSINVPDSHLSTIIASGNVKSVITPPSSSRSNSNNSKKSSQNLAASSISAPTTITKYLNNIDSRDSSSRQHSLTPPVSYSSNDIFVDSDFNIDEPVRRVGTPKSQITGSKNSTATATATENEIDSSATDAKRKVLDELDDLLIPPRKDLENTSDSTALNLTLAESPRTSRFFIPSTGSATDSVVALPLATEENERVNDDSFDKNFDHIFETSFDNTFGNFLKFEENAAVTSSAEQQDIPQKPTNNSIRGKDSDQPCDAGLSPIMESNSDLSNLKDITSEENLDSVLAGSKHELKPSSIAKASDNSYSKLSLNELDDLKPHLHSLNKILSSTTIDSVTSPKFVSSANESSRLTNPQSSPHENMKRSNSLSISVISNKSKKFTKALVSPNPESRRRSVVLENPDNDFSFSSDISDHYNLPLTPGGKINVAASVPKSKDESLSSKIATPKRRSSNGFKTLIKKIFTNESSTQDDESIRSPNKFPSKRTSSAQHLSPKKSNISEMSMSRSKSMKLSSFTKFKEEAASPPPTHCGSVFNSSRFKKFNVSSKSFTSKHKQTPSTSSALETDEPNISTTKNTKQIGKVPGKILQPPSLSEFNPNVKTSNSTTISSKFQGEDLPMFEPTFDESTFGEVMDLLKKDYFADDANIDKDIILSRIDYRVQIESVHGDSSDDEFKNAFEDFDTDDRAKSNETQYLKESVTKLKRKVVVGEEPIFKDDELTKDQIIDQQKKDIDDESRFVEDSNEIDNDFTEEVPLNPLIDSELYIDDNIRSLQEDFSHGFLLHDLEAFVPADDYSSYNSRFDPNNNNTTAASNLILTKRTAYKHVKQFSDFNNLEIITDQVMNVPKDIKPSKNILKMSNSRSCNKASIKAIPKNNSVQFSNKIFINETYPPELYKRYNKSVTQYTLNDPVEIHKIKSELNSYKQNDMRVHEMSQQNTHFFYEF